MLKWTGEDARQGTVRGSRVHTCTPVKHFLVIFGGLNHRVRYNDVWIYDTKNKAWTELRVEASEAEVPAPRAHHAATVVGDKLYVFGGYGGHGKAYDDMYVLDFEPLWRNRRR